MKTRILAILLAITFLSGSGVSAHTRQKNKQNTKSTALVEKNVTTERTYDVTRFSGVSVSAGIKVIYTVSSKVNVTVKATTPELLKRVRVENVNGILSFGIRKKNGRNNGMGAGNMVVAYVSGPSLSSVSASSSGEFKTRSGFNVSEPMTLTTSSSGEISLASVSFSSMEISASSSSEISVDSATGGEIVVHTSSGSEVEFGTASCKSILATGSSGSEISFSRATVKGSTTFSGSSGSEFKIAGSGSHVDFNVSSGAEVKARRFVAKTGVAVSSRSGGDIDCNVDRLEQPSRKIKNNR